MVARTLSLGGWLVAFAAVSKAATGAAAAGAASFGCRARMLVVPAALAAAVLPTFTSYGSVMASGHKGRVVDTALGLMAKSCSKQYCAPGVTGLDLWVSFQEVGLAILFLVRL